MSEPLIFQKLRREVPNERQREFFCSEAMHTAYGGARGGGKSFAMRRKLVMLAMRYPALHLLLLRRTLAELRENHLLPLQSELLGYAEYKKEERTFRFPNGSRLTLGYCDCDSDMLQYQGAEYDVIGFEEATHFKEAVFPVNAKPCTDGGVPLVDGGMVGKAEKIPFGKGTL